MRLHDVLDSKNEDYVSRTDTRRYITCIKAYEKLARMRLGCDVAFGYDEHI